MLRNLVERTPVEIVERTIEFTDAEGNGFSFDADERGNPILANECAKHNYEYAIAHPEEYEIYDELVVRRRTYIEPAHGTCACGTEITLYDEYHGACECEKCGRWYNLFGQELLPPEYWENEEEEW